MTQSKMTRMIQEDSEKDLEKEMSMPDFSYKWRKMEAAGQDRAG